MTGSQMMEGDNTAKHKFLEASELTFQEVFDFAYGSLIPLLQGLAAALGEDQLIKVLKKVSYEAALKAGRDTAQQLPSADFAAYKALVREQSRFGKHVLTLEIVEDSPQALEVKITECLWAETFRGKGVAEIGYAILCHRDYADCQGFDPRIVLHRSKTLMQGDDCCNHRFVWQG
jgi:hypothetical protein